MTQLELKVNTRERSQARENTGDQLKAVMWLAERMAQAF